MPRRKNTKKNKIKDLVEGPELDRIKKIPGSIAGYFADLNKTFNKKSGFAGVRHLPRLAKPCPSSR